MVNGDSDFLYNTRNYDIAYFGGNALDPITRYMNYLSATHPSAWGTGLGEGTVADREIYDTLGSQYLATADPVESKKIGDQLQEQAYDDAYILPIYALNTIAVYNSTRVVIPADIFITDMPQQIDYEWDKWELLK